MNETFASFLEGCRPLFPASLIDAAGWERLMETARALPGSVTGAPFGFEFHLAQPEAAADLCVAAVPGSDLAWHYIGAGRGAEPGSAAAALAAALREQSRNPASYLAHSVGAVLLEYDLVGRLPGTRRPGGRLPPPGIFFAPQEYAPGTRGGLVEHGDPAALLTALAAAAGWSGGANGPPEALPAVERIVAALPDGGFLFQAGVLPARSPQHFRLVIAGVPQTQVCSLLERLQWPGPTAAAAEVIAAVGGLAAYLFVSLDVTAHGPGPRLGLELLGTDWKTSDRTAWHPLIDRIEERGWCLPAKAEGLRNWTRSERLLGGAIFLVRQGINHLKVVIAPDVPTTAKAYGAMTVLPYRSGGGMA